MQFTSTGIMIGGTEWVKWYGVIIVFGALCAAWLAAREARRRGEKDDFVWDGLIWVLIGGVIGARLWHIFTPTASQGITPLYYLTHPLELINTRQGGLGIPGAIIGGGIALYFYTRRRKVSFGFWADMAAPGIALAQAIGRWGNFVNQELYGPPTTLPWGIPIDGFARIPPYNDLTLYPASTHFHPLFLYESLWNLCNMFFLLWLGRRFQKRLLTGDLFLAYAVVYPVGRFFLEFIRVDPALAGGINVNQTIMAVVALSAALLLFLRHRRK